MKKIGLFYSKDTVKTSQIAKKILVEFEENEIEQVPLEDARGKDFERFDNLIFGTSTWFDGELPNAWDELLPEIETLTLSNKKIAIYGLGDQRNYPENFVDGIGLLAHIFEKLGAEIIGFTSIERYQFEKSAAVRGDQFCGLAVDFENQNKLTTQRVKDWSKQLKEEFY
ncbi:MAG: flavodoxin [Paludibacteraceae bacterium]